MLDNAAGMPGGGGLPLRGGREKLKNGCVGNYGPYKVCGLGL